MIILIVILLITSTNVVIDIVIGTSIYFLLLKLVFGLAVA